jgi:hypothetical protein
VAQPRSAAGDVDADRVGQQGAPTTRAEAAHDGDGAGAQLVVLRALERHGVREFHHAGPLA